MKAARMGAGAVKASPELTGWYEGEQRPVRVGVYQRQMNILSHVTYSYWDGEYWCCYANSAIGAEAYIHMSSNWQFVPWRGLAADPSKAVK